MKLRLILVVVELTAEYLRKRRPISDICPYRCTRYRFPSGTWAGRTPWIGGGNRVGIQDALLSWAEPAGIDRPIVLCLLGTFRLFKNGRPVAVRSRGKTESLLCLLALSGPPGVHREPLLDVLWPEADGAHASQSLNSLVYNLHRQLGDAIGHRPPVVYEDGGYRLNLRAGIAVDVAWFDELVQNAGRQAGAGHHSAAARSYQSAARLYRGDLVGAQLQAVMERERLRAAYLNALARLADYSFGEGDYGTSLEYAFRLLVHDPCREDAHRLAMRCYVRQGERAQALRQYALCRTVLRAEFDARPEHSTTVLYQQIRRDPAKV